MNQNPKVTVIIATYNAERNLERAIMSVLSQKLISFELIVIDGGSIDQTLAILSKYSTKLSYVSERDEGISDAFNKGLLRSKGDYIYFLGADDYLINEFVFENIFLNTTNEDVIICGRIQRINEDASKVLWVAPRFKKFEKYFLLSYMALPHQGLFMRKSYFEKYGMFDPNNKYSMDYELLLRSYKEFPRTVIKDTIVAAWREGGIGKDSTLEIFKEYKKIKIKNDVAPAVIIELIDNLNHLKYYIKRIFFNE